ncbi:hypothetical protein EU811_04735 [Arthrobacter sp. TS-15]|nr:hypothetical protein EU811_04735 [Arthrobacter sp. TS-15]
MFAWVCSILWTGIDEGAVPPDSAFPSIPGPSQPRAVSTECGSGGCWREMAVEVEAPHTAESLAAEMGLASDRCGAANLWTLRKTCTGIAHSSAGKLWISLSYSPLISEY